MSEIEVDTARYDELDAMIGLMAEAFGLPSRPAREVFYADPYFAIENKRVLRVQGRMVSCLTIMDSLCWIGGAQVRLAGIAGVVTLPDERNKGYAGKLLQATLSLLRERGYPLSALFPFSFPYYRKFGWERAGDAARFLITPDRLLPYPEYRYVRPAHPGDIPQLEMLYRALTEQRTFHCLRDAKRWRYVLDNVKERWVYSPDGLHVEGYLLYEPKEMRLPEGADGTDITLPPTLRVLEMRSATAAARRGLLGFLAAQQNYSCIEFEAPVEDLAANGLLELIGYESDALCNIEIVPVLMARVVHLARLAEALRPNWVGFEGDLVLEMRDSRATPPESAALISGSGGQTLVRELISDECPRFADRLSGDVRAWSQVLTGYRAGDDACALNLLQPSTPHAAELSAQLFPARAPYLPLPDHF